MMGRVEGGMWDGEWGWMWVAIKSHTGVGETLQSSWAGILAVAFSDWTGCSLNFLCSLVP